MQGHKFPPPPARPKAVRRLPSFIGERGENVDCAHGNSIEGMGLKVRNRDV